MVQQQVQQQLQERLKETMQDTDRRMATMRDDSQEVRNLLYKLVDARRERDENAKRDLVNVSLCLCLCLFCLFLFSKPREVSQNCRAAARDPRQPPLLIHEGSSLAPSKGN